MKIMRKPTNHLYAHTQNCKMKTPPNRINSPTIENWNKTQCDSSPRRQREKRREKKTQTDKQKREANAAPTEKKMKNDKTNETKQQKKSLENDRNNLYGRAERRK